MSMVMEADAVEMRDAMESAVAPMRQAGLDALARGDGAQAAAEFEQLVEDGSQEVSDYLNLGNAYLLLRRNQDAARCFLEVLARAPASAEARHNLGLACLGMGAWADAALCFGEAIAFRRPYPQASEALGFALERLDRLDEAAGSYRDALREEPDRAALWRRLAAVLVDTGKYDEAGQALLESERREPGSADAALVAGLLAQRQRDFTRAEQGFRAAVAQRPEWVEAWCNLSSALALQGRGVESGEAALKALRRNPRHVGSHCNFALARKLVGDYTTALECYRRAMAIQPEDARVHWNLAVTLLAMGQWEERWREFDWRFEAAITRRRQYDAPVWDGSDIGGRTILVWAEQGLGDTIQFLRFLPPLRAKGARIILEVPGRLLPLLDHAPVLRETGTELVGQGEDLPPFDAHIPMMSLPRWMGGAPVGTGLLACHRRPSTPPPCSVPKVGLCWSGNPEHYHDHFRSIDPALLAPLRQIDNLHWFALQREGKCPWEGIHRPEDHTTDLMDAAAIVSELDLVITVDTMVTHLAATLGRPVWLLLPAMADWRWGIEGTSTHWYPSVRLFRQQAMGDWGPVIAELASELTSWRDTFQTTPSWRSAP